MHVSMCVCGYISEGKLAGEGRGDGDGKRLSRAHDVVEGNRVAEFGAHLKLTKRGRAHSVGRQ